MSKKSKNKRKDDYFQEDFIQYATSDLSESPSDLIIPVEQSKITEIAQTDKELAGFLVYSGLDDYEKQNEEAQNAIEKEYIKPSENLSFESMNEYAQENNTKPFVKQKSKTQTILLCVALLVFCCSVIALGCNLYGYNKASDMYDDLRIMANGNLAGYDSLHLFGVKSNGLPTNKLSDNLSPSDSYTQAVEQKAKQSYEKFLPVFDTLSQINSDTMGWITVEDTNIDYPFVKGKDNEYYLNHTFDNSYLSAGTIFADWKNSKQLTQNKNLVLYGHHMRDGSMFADLSKLKEKSVFSKTKITIITPDGVYEYTPFSVFTTNSKDMYFQTEFDSAESFDEFIATYKEKSMFSTGQNVTSKDNVLTLSTCTSLLRRGRLVVMAYLTNIYH